MLPAHQTGLTEALTTVAGLQHLDQQARLRVGLTDGSVVDGVLISASTGHVSLLLPTSKAQYIAAEHISSVHLATRRAGREFIIVGGIVVGVTAVIVGVAQVPLLLSHLPRIAGSLTIFAFAGVVLLKRRTALGSWLTAWKTLFEADSP